MFIPSRLHYWLVKKPFSWQPYEKERERQTDRQTLTADLNVNVLSSPLPHLSVGVWEPNEEKLLVNSAHLYSKDNPLLFKEAGASHSLLGDGLGRTWSWYYFYLFFFVTLNRYETSILFSQRIQAGHGASCIAIIVAQLLY